MGALRFFSRGAGVERDIEFTELLRLNCWAGAFAGRVVPRPIIPGAPTEAGRCRAGGRCLAAATSPAL
jgi:hypothetical protein